MYSEYNGHRGIVVVGIDYQHGYFQGNTCGAYDVIHQLMVLAGHFRAVANGRTRIKDHLPPIYSRCNHMNRKNNLLKSWLLMGMLASLMMFVVSNIASAQDELPCKCEVGTISVDNNVACKFEVCIKDADGFHCITLGPGSVEQFKCHDVAVIYLKDCDGNLVRINDNDDNCVYCTCVGFKRCCAVDACVTFDRKGCLHVKITPSPCRIVC